jgi:hypothetical protein
MNWLMGQVAYTFFGKITISLKCLLYSAHSFIGSAAISLFDTTTFCGGRELERPLLFPESIFGSIQLRM